MPKHVRPTPQIYTITSNSILTKPFSIAVKEDRISLWYIFEKQAAKYADAPCIWSRTGCYTWKEVHDQSCRYAQYFISIGVQPGQLVGMYLMNCPEFMFVWMALWSLGCAPAQMNYNLTGDALVHCLTVSEAKILLVDADEGCQARINDTRERIEGQLGMKTIVLSPEKKAEINAFAPTVPERRWRDGMKGSFPMCLLYTRY
jgi:acyl-CoA synthetase (AMP-forming)/AMP-acid ligase II